MAFSLFLPFTPSFIRLLLLLIKPFWTCLIVILYPFPYCPSLLDSGCSSKTLFLSFSPSPSMTSVYLNPASSSFPFVDLKEEQHLQLFLSPNQAATSLSGPTNFFNATHDQREGKLRESRQHDDHEVDKYSISFGRSSDHKLSPSSSFQPVVNDDDNSNFHKLSSSKTEDGIEGSGDSSVKWMPSKMRLMQKMINSNRSETDNQPMKFMLKFHNQQCQNNDINSSSNSSNTNIRVCSDCNTTSTPLWRSGPRGPKSLCNACGIRQRKARRAMAAAANGTVIAIEASSFTKSKVNNKVKKLRTSHVSQGKKLNNRTPDSPLQSQKKLCFKNLALSLSKNPALQQVLPHDVEEAAILLMELSCGFIHS